MPQFIFKEITKGRDRAGLCVDLLRFMLLQRSQSEILEVLLNPRRLRTNTALLRGHIKVFEYLWSACLRVRLGNLSLLPHQPSGRC